MRLLRNVITLIALLGQAVLLGQNKSGTIKIAKADTDTACLATFMGYSGKSFITKKELSNAKKLDLNHHCKCKIESFRLSYISPANSSKSQITQGAMFDDGIFKRFIDEMLFLKIEKIIAKDTITGAEINLPKIIFTVIE